MKDEVDTLALRGRDFVRRTLGPSRFGLALVLASVLASVKLRRGEATALKGECRNIITTPASIDTEPLTSSPGQERLSKDGA